MLVRVVRICQADRRRDFNHITDLRPCTLNCWHSRRLTFEVRGGRKAVPLDRMVSRRCTTRQGKKEGDLAGLCSP